MKSSHHKFSILFFIKSLTFSQIRSKKLDGMIVQVPHVEFSFVQPKSSYYWLFFYRPSSMTEFDFSAVMGDAAMSSPKISYGLL